MRKLVSNLIRRITTNKGNKYCSICKNNIPFFLPHPKIMGQPSLIREFKVIGSDLVNYMCPSCHSHDRERHLVLFFENTDILGKIQGSDILHFAPEKNIPQFINSLDPESYTKCDLYPGSNDIEKIDMQSIPYSNESFDLIIANHVLEHVENDSKALIELSRVLRDDGCLVLQTPYSSLLHKTLDDPGINTDSLRTQLCGQSDHLRLYGKDFFKKVESFGFKSKLQTSSFLLPGKCPKKYGINNEEPFMLFEKVPVHFKN